MSLDHFPLNPCYGHGIFRRVVSICPRSGSVLATIDDTHHAMWMLIEHDDEVVRSIEGGLSRGPANTCPAAASGLRELVGHRLNEKPRSTLLPTLENCTHLTDLAIWALQNARVREQVVYEVAVPDQTTEPVWISIARNGRRIHRWLIKDHRVVEPKQHAGEPLMGGFAVWARASFSGLALEAAQMLQRGVFVARGRRNMVDLAPIPLRAAKNMAGACFSYAPNQLKAAHSQIGYVRDFTDGVTKASPPDYILKRFRGSLDELT